MTLPDLPYDDWAPTKDTLHLWCQIVGKVQLALTPPRNQWWQVPLLVSARGLTTRRMPVASRNLEIEVDLVDSRLHLRTTEGQAQLALVDGLSVGDFYERVLALLADLGVEARIRPEPFGVPVTTPFPEDTEHASFDAGAARRFLAVLQWSADVLEEFAGWSRAKTSPVHVFWHSFDLAVTRFSGRPAPVAPDADPVSAEAYSQEVVSFGFWAGDREQRFPAYYAYAAPEPAGLREEPLRPGEASWVERGSGSLALLPYDAVRGADDPRTTLLAFLQSAYEAGGTLAGWDLEATTTPWCPTP